MKKKTVKSACRKTWILKDGRIGFQFGKVYAHGETERLSIKGEGGIVMFMEEEKYHEHFESIK